MATTYSVADLKTLVLNQVNGVKGMAASFPNADAAYDEAVRQCGFSNPEASDAAAEVKTDWLIQRMRRWFIEQLQIQYILRFDTGDLRSGQISRNLEKKIAAMDQAFSDAKNNDATAHLFIDASAFFGKEMVMTSGFVDSKLGEDLSGASMTKTTRPKQPKSTEALLENLE